jgi:nicotinate-nucleotide pyrophosphorylase (carboxylating)
MDAGASMALNARDGDAFEAGAVLADAEADARAFLSAERTALNLLGRLCGVATLTRAYVDAVAGTGARIADTRKTTPGLRALEKHAVRCGGGVNHRFGLDDAVLIKDNHVAVCGGVEPAVRAARANVGHLMKVELEVDGLDQFREALALVQTGKGPDVIMLDNFTLSDLSEAVRLRDASGLRTPLEASGGVNLQTVRAIAETGVDIISVGALTHSAPVLDIGLDSF